MTVVGLLTSDALNNGFIPHNLQNLKIRDFLNSKNLQYGLAWTEFKGERSNVLESLLKETFYAGICFFSIEQVLRHGDPERILTDLIDRGLWIGFALEEICLRSRPEVDNVVRLLRLRYWINRKTQ